MLFLSTPIQEGVIILITGMTIVFVALILLFVVFHYVVPLILKQKKYEVKGSEKTDNVSQSPSSGSGEEIAAVCSAVYMFLEEAHDEENAILTIGKSVKDYSPWSSKIYVTHRFATR